MTLVQTLGFSPRPESEWPGWVITTNTDWAAGVNQAGRQHRLELGALTDGRYICNANLLTEETGLFADALAALPVAEVQAMPMTVCRALLYPSDDLEAGQAWPEWEQVLGAGLGPQGAEDGWPVGARVTRDGHVWVSRVSRNVNEPLVDVTSTWSRSDGTYVVPAGWEYQPGEEVTEDGGATWWRARQEINHSPSAYPAGYVQIDGPGGEPLPEPTETPEWQEWDGHNENLYQIGDRVTYHGDTWEATSENNHWEPGVFGWVKIT